MSLSLRRHPTVGAIALCAIVGGSAGSAVAADPPPSALAELSLKCNLPLIGAQPITLRTRTPLPQGFVAGTPTGPLPIDATVTLGGNWRQGLSLLGAATIKGAITLDVSVSGGGGSQTSRADLAFGAVDVESFTSSSITFEAGGDLPPLTFAENGPFSVRVSASAIQVELRKANGVEVQLPPDPFGDPSPFGGPCVLDSSGQDPTLLDGVVGPSEPDTQAPTRPTSVVVSDVSRFGAWITWQPSTDNRAVRRYEVTYGGSQATTADVRLAATGLEPSTDYPVSVVAVDAAGNRSEPAVTSFRTPPDAPPTVPQGLVARPGITTIDLDWEPSVDDGPLVTYEVLEGGESIRRLEGSFVRVNGLEPATTYRFAVRARDSAGQVSASTDEIVVTTKPSLPVFEDPDLVLTYQCTYPLIGEQPLRLRLKVDAPSLPLPGVPAPSLPVTASLLAEGSTLAGMNLIGAGSLDGTAHVATNLAFEGEESPVSLPLRIRPVTIGQWPEALDLRASGSLPSVTLPPGATAVSRVQALRLNLIARRAEDGTPIDLPTALGVPDSDANPATFDVPCRLDPVGQPATLLEYAGAPLPVRYGFGASGAATLKTLTRGSVPLAGSIDAELNVATGAFSAALALEPATARLTTLGFLPVTADVAFVPVGPTTGTLSNSVLTSNSRVRIKLPQVSLFGVQLAGGSTCQTKTVSNIALRSTGPAFDPLAGGTLAGTFAISDLTGCGFLTGLISPLTKGEGNAIALKLTPRS